MSFRLLARYHPSINDFERANLLFAYYLFPIFSFNYPSYNGDIFPIRINKVRPVLRLINGVQVKQICRVTERSVCNMAGKNMHIRFQCSTGDAMGMNMVSKGVQHVLDYLLEGFPDMDVIGVSGNRCLFVMLLFSLVVIGTRSNLIAE